MWLTKGELSAGNWIRGRYTYGLDLITLKGLKQQACGEVPEVEVAPGG
jgi:hypothetical protein